MAFIFGDGFDFYALVSDGNGYWDSAPATGGAWSLAAGRFPGSQAINYLASSILVGYVKSSPTNDATHHIVCSFMQTSPLTSAGNTGLYLQLLDGNNGQVCIGFRNDGAIVLTSGSPGGTILATYANAFYSNVWASFEFEVLINNGAGTFTVRKDGALSANFTATGLSTRPGSTNAYANKLQVGGNTNASLAFGRLDDLLWFSTSGAAPNTWVGDVRAYQLMPTSDASVQLTKAPTSIGPTYVQAAQNGNSGPAANIIWFSNATVIASQTGTVSALVANFAVAVTGHVNMALYDATGPGGSPGALVGACTAVTNPGTGNNTFTMPSPPSVIRGAAYYLAMMADTSIATAIYGGTLINAYTLANTYASGFPSSAAGTGRTGNQTGFSYLGMTITPTNSTLVNEVLQDGGATYLFDSTVGHADLYNVADLPANIASITCLTTRAYMEKSDAGARTGRVQLKSGAAAAVTGDLLLSASFSWCSRTDTVDPNTGAAWTLAAANAVQIGPVVAA
jgi:hypothetical protein